MWPLPSYCIHMSSWVGLVLTLRQFLTNLWHIWLKRPAGTVCVMFWRSNCDIKRYVHNTAVHIWRNVNYSGILESERMGLAWWCNAMRSISALSPPCGKGHYGDVTMGTIASQITSLVIVFSTVHLDTDQRKHQSSASLAFVWGIHRGPVNSPHKWPVTRKIFPFDDVIMMMSWHCHTFPIIGPLWGNPPIPGGFPHIRPAMQRYVYFIVRLSKLISKQWNFYLWFKHN